MQTTKQDVVQPFAVRSARVRGVPVLTVLGELDAFTVKEMEPALQGLVLEEEPAYLLFDLTGLRYLDSAGIAVLFRLLRTLGERGMLGLVGVGDLVRRLLVITDLALHPNVLFFSSVEEAVGRLGSWAPGGTRTTSTTNP